MSTFLTKSENFKNTKISEISKTEILLEQMLTHIIEHFSHIDAHALVNYIRDCFTVCHESPPPPNKQ